VAGGTVVTVTGSGFLYTAQLSCKFATTVITATYLTASTAACVAPANGGVGSVTLEMSNNGQVFTSTGGRFYYMSASPSR
jgi:hypothetical protein